MAVKSKPSRRPAAAGRQIRDDLRNAERLLGAGQGALARTLLHEVAQHAPRSPELLRLLAIDALMDGRAREALAHAQAACAVAPQRAEFAMLVGRAHKALNELEPAIQAYRRAIVLQPHLAQAHVSLGIALKAHGDLDAAVDSYRKALGIDPHLSEAHAALANALAMKIAKGEGDGAAALDEERLAALQRAVELDPHSAVARHQLGVMLSEQGRHESAVEHFNAALAIDPRREDSCVLMHAALTKLNYLAAARECCERWLELNEPTPAVTNRLVTTLLALNDFDAALRWGKTAQALAPDMPEVLHNLAAACQQTLDVPAALQYLQRAISVAPHYKPARDVLMMSLCYVEEDPAVNLAVHRQHAPQAVAPADRPAAWSAGQLPIDRLRVGYVGGDFRRHSVSYFMEPLLEAHDRARFELVAYHTDDACDEVTGRLKRLVSSWVDASSLTDDEFERRIRADRIDVLVDLSGHTSGGRLGVFARRPAPVQMTYLGYPTTTGMGAIDHRITDGIIDPMGAEAFSSEALLRCARGMFCYRPDARPDVGELPHRRNGYITFGSFNNLAKLSDKALALWAEALHAVPGSKLLLKARSLSSSVVSSRLVQRFGALGIGEDRLQLSGWRADLHSHLDVYREIDIGLDTFPYNGATTTCESLWMGVPVVTLCGRTHVSRMGASILNAAGLQGWTARTPAEFVDLAARHAARPDELARFRALAREQLTASALMDAPAFAADFEALLVQAWERRALHGERTPA